MIQRRSGARFAVEALLAAALRRESRWQNPEGYVAMEPRVVDVYTSLIPPLLINARISQGPS